MSTTRRTLIAGAGALALTATQRGSLHAERDATPLAGPDITGDYELTIRVEYDLQDYGARRTGGQTVMTYGQFEVAASRENGAWQMHMQQVLADDPATGEHIFGPDLIDVRDQTDGPDPLVLLQGLLAGHAALDGSKVIHGLSRRQLDALALLPIALRDELLGLMGQRDDDVASWFGRWALTATARDFDGLPVTSPYTELAARVRAEDLPGKHRAARARELRLMADAMEAGLDVA